MVVRQWKGDNSPQQYPLWTEIVSESKGNGFKFERPRELRMPERESSVIPRFLEFCSVSLFISSVHKNLISSRNG